jgi:NAD(P)-dependent dehydrogenase (short-subunit alcohol dehydrogenase family)
MKLGASMKQFLIVGGSKGIGLAITQALLKQGCQVYVWARNPVDNPADIQGAQLIANDVTGVSKDLTGELDLSYLPEVLDGVVYCPGSINLKPFHRLSVDDFARDWQINVMGAVATLQAVLPRLKNAEQASVVLFSTVAVTLGMPFHASIASAKGAVEGLTKSLAAEWAPKIRVNAIAPSLTQTPLAEKLLSNAEKMEAASKRHPLQKIGSPEDLAAMATFLLGNESRWITGQVMHVDGGLSSVKL